MGLNVIYATRIIAEGFINLEPDSRLISNNKNLVIRFRIPTLLKQVQTTLSRIQAKDVGVGPTKKPQNYVKNPSYLIITQ